MLWNIVLEGGNVGPEFAERWKVEILTKGKESSQGADKSHLTRHILPYLGKLRLDAIGVENQQTFRDSLADEVSYKSVLNILSTLSSILDTAKKLGLRLRRRGPAQTRSARARELRRKRRASPRSRYATSSRSRRIPGASCLRVRPFLGRAPARFLA